MTTRLEQAIAALSRLPEAEQEEVAAAILNTLQERAPRLPVMALDIQAEPFFGMWRDRDDLGDSAAWVRDFRVREWGHSG